jgi:hypothetical protein
VLHHDVVVVEEPLAGGADVQASIGGLVQAVVGSGKDPAGLVQPGE